MSPSGFEIEIDRNACRGAGVCVRLAPSSFALDSEQRSRVLDGAGDNDETLQAAADRCPYFAIRLIQREPGVNPPR